MLQIKTIAQFEIDFRRVVRTGNDAFLFWAVVELIANQETIPDEFRDHELGGKWAGIRDIHIEADWLLLYQIAGRDLVLMRTGSHNDLFSKS